MHVTIGIVTCGRPDGLARLLRSLAAQQLRDPAPAVEVLVVDNHPDGGAAEVCAAAAASMPRFAMRCEREVQRGIPFARNAVIRLASPGTDFVAFVDDDETVDPDWLEALLDVQARTGADVVTGPALPRLPDDAPAWLAASGAFDLLRFETGTARPFAFTHNVLARRAVFSTVLPNFDERLAPCGGSDTHFFRRVAEAGGRIVWADEAVAHEWIPSERASVGWLLRRALRIGGTDAIIERDLVGGAKAVIRLPLRAARYVARGALRALATPVRGRAAMLAAGRDLAHALGLVGGLVGLAHAEYRPRD